MILQYENVFNNERIIPDYDEDIEIYRHYFETVKVPEHVKDII